MKHRLLALFLTLAMLVSLVPSVAAERAEDDGLLRATVEQVDNSEVKAPFPVDKTEKNQIPIRDADEQVRVSIFLEQPSALDAGYEVRGANAQTSAYRKQLEAQQQRVQNAIEREVLDGEKLDVAWKLTLVTNLISATVRYGDIERIEEVDGVRKVVLERRYEPTKEATDSTVSPNMQIATLTTGAQLAWAAGYTGAGGRIAIIDSGFDSNHQSFDDDAFAFALHEDADLAGQDYETYIGENGKDLLDVEEIRSVLPDLNAYEVMHWVQQDLTADELYHGLKNPFGFNYIDLSLNITHDQDNAGEHGSHVAGIAAANRYLKRGDSYVSALDNVSVVGLAPDAQVLVMKVFGALGGAYDSDYLAATEDAILLGADSVNLSLGSASAGFSNMDASYDDIFTHISESGIVMATSAGNNGRWSEHDNSNDYELNGQLYSGDINFATGGYPGSLSESFATASSDNAGTTGPYFDVDEQHILYTDSSSSDMMFGPFSQLDTEGTGTELEYVFFDGYGTYSDNTFKDVSTDLTRGKIVFVSRGNSGDIAATFAQKVEYTVEHTEAKGVVVYNNEDGYFWMDLILYPLSTPAVSISKVDADAIRAASEKHQVGDTTYYTGTMTVYSDGRSTTVLGDLENPTMSSFSSWGVPSDLSLKPEVTAPGGSIYSVNGADPSGTAYETMSGTSMSSPQTAALVALINQYIDENGLRPKDITARQLAHSLLMSTARPLLDPNSAEGKYYPVIQQGAGLIDAAAATSANSYLTVAGVEDGKAKVELGDDPERKGSYSFDFTLHNFTAKPLNYGLSAELFTQALFEEDGWEYLSTGTRTLTASAVFSVNGQVLSTADDMTDYDFNGDGVYTQEDAQLLLDNAVKGTALKAHEKNGDLNSDGKVTSYDVYLLLRESRNHMLTVPASGEVTVHVELTLPEATKTMLTAEYPHGAYLEGYVFLEPYGDDEGLLPTRHSIPILGFFGGWTEASMVDAGSATDYYDATDEEYAALQPPYLGSFRTNYLTMISENGTETYFGGNPILGLQGISHARDAFNNTRGDRIGNLVFSPIRNAGATRFLLKNVTKDLVIYDDAFYSQIPAAYYYSGSGQWTGTAWQFNIDDPLAQFDDGDEVLLQYTLAPEYYFNKQGKVEDWDALGDGASLTYSFVIDNTPPEINGESVVYDKANNTISLKASDNNYVSAVLLYDSGGLDILAYDTAKADAEKGQEYTFTLPTGNLNGRHFLVSVADYASNVTTYRVLFEIGEPQPLPEMMAFFTHRDDYYDIHTWEGIRLTEDGQAEGYRYAASDGDAVRAAAIAWDDYVYMVTENRNLYVAPVDDISYRSFVRRLDRNIGDLAFDTEHEILYGIAVNGSGNSDGDQLVTIAEGTGELKEVAKLPYKTNNLTYRAEDHSFYYVQHNVESQKLRKFTLDGGTVQDSGVPLSTFSNYLYTSGPMTLEADPNHSNYLWCVSYDSSDVAHLLRIDLNYCNAMSFTNPIKDYRWPGYQAADLAVTRTGDRIMALILPKNTDVRVEDPTPATEVTEVVMEPTTVTVFRGATVQLTASVLPWTLSNREVEWSTDQPTVATVDQKGLVKTVGGGKAIITATSKADRQKLATCEINVETVPVVLEGILQHTENGQAETTRFNWDVGKSGQWDEVGDPLNLQFISAFDNGDGYFYSYNANRQLSRTKLESGETEVLATSDVLFASIGKSPYSTPDAPKIAALVDQMVWSEGEASWVSNATIYLDLDANTLELSSATRKYNLGPVIESVRSRTGSAYLSTFAYGGRVKAEDLSASLYMKGDVDIFYLVDNVGYLWTVYSGDWAHGPGVIQQYDNTPTDLTAAGYVYARGTAGTTLDSMTVADNGDIYLTNFTGAVTKIFRLEAGDRFYHATYLGDMGAGVFPVALFSGEAYERDAAGGDVETGSLNAVTAYRPEEPEKENVVFDRENGTLTVTVSAKESTNGMFAVEYDPDVLTLQEATGGDVLLSSVDTATRGTVKAGYAATSAVSTSVLVLRFAYQPEGATGVTELTLTVTEDGASDATTAEKLTVTLPSDCEHETLEHHPAQMPTLQKEGNIEFWYCPICNRYFRDAKASVQIRREDTVLPRLTGDYIDLPEDAWYYEAAYYMIAHGYMGGTAPRIFSPEGTLTRGELVTILYRIAGSPAVTGATKFTDVPADQFYYDPVRWAEQNNVVNGMTLTTFEPESPITREQIATILYRYVKAEKVSEDHLSAFTDGASVSDYAKDAMNWAVSVGLFNGDHGRLLPLDNASRAEIAAILMRWLER